MSSRDDDDKQDDGKVVPLLRGGPAGQAPVPGPAPGPRPAPPAVPGVTLTDGPGPDSGAGELWLGTAADGTRCVVRLVALPPDPERRRSSLAAAQAVAAVSHPHLVPYTAVTEVDEGIALVSPQVDGAVSLRRLMAARESLEPGEIVTIGLPIAQALDAAHAAGIAHGALTPADILLELNGRPQLSGLGLGFVRAAATDTLAPPSVSTDVFDLADILLEAMSRSTGPQAAAVAVAVAQAMVPDEDERPSAKDLGRGIAHSARPMPVQMASTTTPPPTPEEPPPRRPAGTSTTETLDLSPVPRARPRVREARPAALPGAPAPEPAPGTGGPVPGTGPSLSRPVAETSGVPGRAALPARPATPRPPRPRPPARTTTAAPPDETPGSLLDSPAPRPAAPAPRTAHGAGPSSGAGRALRPAGRARRSGSRGARAGRRRGRLLLVATGVTGAVVIAVAAVLLHGAGGGDGAQNPAAARSQGTAAASGSASPAATDWTAVLTGLEQARSRAYENADPTALADVYEQGAAIEAAEQVQLSQIMNRGAHVSGLPTRVLALAVQSESADRAVLRVTEQLGAFDYLDAQGRTLNHQEQAEPRTDDVTLVRTEAGWRISARAAAG